MPTAEQIKPHVQEASLITLCSPQNPTGTVFTKQGLEERRDLIFQENKRRGEHAKPVYLCMTKFIGRYIWRNSTLQSCFSST